MKKTILFTAFAFLATEVYAMDVASEGLQLFSTPFGTPKKTRSFPTSFSTPPKQIITEVMNPFAPFKTPDKHYPNTTIMNVVYSETKEQVIKSWEEKSFFDLAEAVLNLEKADNDSFTRDTLMKMTENFQKHNNNHLAVSQVIVSGDRDSRLYSLLPYLFVS